MKRLLALALPLFACGSPQIDRLVRFDAGADVADAITPVTYPDAGDPDLGGPCVDDGQCDDKIACTYDRCDTTVNRCRNTPDDSLCDDNVYCNGHERCIRKTGCGPGPVVSCDDNTACTIDRCDEQTRQCSSVLRDADKDGDPDDHCLAKHDCDDLDPSVSSLRSEVCANGKDDNCNGVIDEQGCTSPQYTTCQNALAISAPGTWVLSSAGAPKTFTASCSVPMPNGAHDLVALVTIPSGPNKDLDVWVASADKKEVSVAIFGACNQAQTEIACGDMNASMTRARARNLAPGTYTVVATAQTETNVQLSIDFLTASSKPANEDCTAPQAITPGISKTVEIIDPAKDLPSACAASTGELTYALTVPQPSDVRVYTQTLKGSGTPVIGLRAPSCSGQNDELRCRSGTSLPLLARSVPAGTYVLTVAATSPIDASVLVQLSPPTMAPAGQVCSTAPDASFDKTIPFDLSSFEDAIKDGCFPGGPTASFKVDLAQPSDVLLVGRFPQNEMGAVSFDAPGCTVSDKLVCTASYTPVRASKRNVPAGSYRAVVADQYGQQGSLSTFVRPTVAPINVTTADNCSDFVDIPPAGGFLAGDTTMKTADFDESCDAPNLPMYGGPDQIFRLVLAQTKRVVLDMSGSPLLSILSLRKGNACPGVEIMNGCNVGFSAQRSFLDTTLGAGTYWVVVDGYAMQKGAWNLDVRVVDP